MSCPLHELYNLLLTCRATKMTRSTTADPMGLLERLTTSSSTAAPTTTPSGVANVAKPAANGSKRPTPIIIYPTGKNTNTHEKFSTLARWRPNLINYVQEHKLTTSPSVAMIYTCIYETRLSLFIYYSLIDIIFISN